METHFLRSIRVSEITQPEVEDIETKTRSQAKSDLWVEERTKRLTASHFGEICKSIERRNKTALAQSLTMIKKLHTAPVNHGRRYEDVAVELYEQKLKVTTKPCGLFVCLEMPFLAASPDGVVNDVTLLEVKCPYAAREQMINPKTVPFLCFDGNSELQLDCKHPYYYQVQGQMLCSGAQKCDLVVYTFKDFKIVPVVYDRQFVQGMTEQLKSFYDEYFRDAVVSTHFYKNYYQYFAK